MSTNAALAKIFNEMADCYEGEALGQIEDARGVLDVQRRRWQQWHPGHPMTVRSLVAEFPPLLRAVDRNRLTKGLKSALETS